MRAYDRVLFANPGPYGAGAFYFRNKARELGDGKFAFSPYQRGPVFAHEDVPLSHAPFFPTERGLMEAIEMRNLRC